MEHSSEMERGFPRYHCHTQSSASRTEPSPLRSTFARASDALRRMQSHPLPTRSPTRSHVEPADHTTRRGLSWHPECVCCIRVHRMQHTQRLEGLTRLCVFAGCARDSACFSPSGHAVLSRSRQCESRADVMRSEPTRR